jgi:hypothetical protein
MSSALPMAAGRSCGRSAGHQPEGQDPVLDPERRLGRFTYSLTSRRPLDVTGLWTTSSSRWPDRQTEQKRVL